MLKVRTGVTDMARTQKVESVLRKRVSMLFAILVLAGAMSHARVAEKAQGLSNVLINEFELNPPGDDSAPGAEFVELYNSGPTPVGIGGWKVATTHGVPVVVTIPSGVGIPAGGFYVVTHTTQWLDNTDERIILKDAVGAEIDTTPVKSDPFNDARTWQRYPDGASNWAFDTATRATINIPEFPAPSLVMVASLVAVIAILRRRKANIGLVERSQAPRPDGKVTPTR